LSDFHKDLYSPGDYERVQRNKSSASLGKRPGFDTGVYQGYQKVVLRLSGLGPRGDNRSRLDFGMTPAQDAATLPI
jgi:hypothetical protein